MIDHINNVVDHYGNDVICWDVVNEAMSDDGTGLKSAIKGIPHIW